MHQRGVWYNGKITGTEAYCVSYFGVARIRLPLAVVAIMAVAATARGDAADTSDRVDWATGTAFQRALDEPCDILWAANPLRQALKSVSSARRVAILLDRRVDPGQKLDVSLRGAPLRSAIETIAERRGLGVATLGSVVYVGPPAAAGRLAAIAAAADRETRNLPSSLRSKYRQMKAFAWDDLATPRDLLERLSKEGGLVIRGLERVPHDLWAAVDLPPMKLVDRLALIAVQFDLAVRISDRGKRVELVPLPEELRRLPPPERHAVRSHATPKRPPAAQGEPPLSIVVREQPLKPVLKKLADRLGLELKMDEPSIRAAGVSLDQRVSIRIENATIDEVLRQLLKSTGLTFRRRDRLIEILPVEK
jgi:hypothetical protein